MSMTRPRLKLQRVSQGYYCGIPKIGDRVFGQGNKRNINETSSDSTFLHMQKLTKYGRKTSDGIPQLCYLMVVYKQVRNCKYAYHNHITFQISKHSR